MATAVALPPDLRSLWTLPGVYAPQMDTCLLARAMHAEGVTADMDVLDVCTGSGALALLAARRGARVSATDISWRAVLSARINAARGGYRVRVRCGDLTGPVGDHRFDLVMSNPPYVPTARVHRLRRHRPSVAWDAGRSGRETLDRMCSRIPSLLRPHGVLLMVHSGLCGVEETQRQLSDAGLTCSISTRAAVPFGPVVTERLPWLREQGLIGADEDKEELVVIRAERS